eukprot:7850991-Lingulodinium_polyedra.AAC.1
MATTLNGRNRVSPARNHAESSCGPRQQLSRALTSAVAESGDDNDAIDCRNYVADLYLRNKHSAAS